MDFNNKILKQVYQRECLRIIEADFKSAELYLADWCDVIEESFFIEISKSYSFITLHLIKIPYLSASLSLWLKTYIAPILASIIIVECNSLSWKKDIKPLLVNASALQVIDLQGE
jgi:hypothetical protein